MEEKNQKNTTKEDQETKEYRQFIKESALEGQYFKDALDWYFFRYIGPLCDRTIMIFGAIIGAISLFCLVQIINGMFPLVQKVPIVIHAKDQSIYTPFIKSLRNAQEKDISVDDAISKYLLAVYVNDRESFDYRKSEVEDVNRKFSRIKNTSSYAEYKNFQAAMSKDNADSPLNQFGQNVFASTQINSVNLIYNQPQDYYFRIKNFFSSALPTEAEVRFTKTIHNFDDAGNEKSDKINYLAKIKFGFSGVDRNAKTGIMNFTVNSYKLYKIK